MEVCQVSQHVHCGRGWWGGGPAVPRRLSIQITAIFWHDHLPAACECACSISTSIWGWGVFVAIGARAVTMGR